MPLDPIVEARRDDVVALCRKHKVRALYVFGSAASGGFVAGKSDLDFLVEFEALSSPEHAEAYFGLAFGLEDLFGTEVDLLESEPIRNPYLRASIEQSKLPFYAAA